MKIIVGLLLLITPVFYITGPMSLEERIASKELELVSLLKQPHDSGFEQLDNFQKQKERFLSKLLPAGKEVDAVLAVSRSLVESGLEIDAVRYSSPMEGAGLTRFGFTVPARGDLRAFEKWLDSMKNFPGLTFLDSLKIMRIPENERTFKFELELATIIH